MSVTRAGHPMGVARGVVRQAAAGRDLQLAGGHQLLHTRSTPASVTRLCHEGVTPLLQR